MRRSIYFLFLLNLLFVLFPVLSTGRTSTNDEMFFVSELGILGPIISSVLTPLIVGGAVLGCSRHFKIIAQWRFLLISVMYAWCVIMSVAASGSFSYAVLIMSVFFVLFSLYLENIISFVRVGQAAALLRIFKYYFSAWLLAPFVIMAVMPSTYDMFVTGNSYHGLSISRVGFGLWAGAFALLIGSSKRVTYRILFIVTLLALLLSQSRAAMVGLVIAYGYMLWREGGWRAIMPLSAVAMLVAAIIILWTTLGRGDVLDISDDREMIYLIFIEYIKNNWMFGYGGMKLIEIMEFDNIPAHNLLLQWIANYGIFTLAMLVGWLAAVFGLLRTTLARKLLIYFVICSMCQPVQGTGNFFGPVTLLYFLVIFCVEIVERTPTIKRPSVIEAQPVARQI